MSKRLLPSLLAGILLACPSSFASACLNDSDTLVAEQEFSSSYGRSGPARASTYGIHWHLQATGLLLLVPGAVLILLGMRWARREKLQQAQGDALRFRRDLRTGH